MQEILQRAIDKYGKQMQMVVAMEEMAELTKELSKALRGKPNTTSIAEEIADVEIMLEQIKIIFDCEEYVHDMEDYKLKRLSRRLGE